MTRTKASLVLVGVFVLGTLAGAFATGAFVSYRLGHLGSGRVEGFEVHRLSRRLNLDVAQHQLLETVADRTRARLAEVPNEVRPRIDSILEQAYQDLRPTLRPEQQKELEKVQEETRQYLDRLRPRRP